MDFFLYEMGFALLVGVVFTVVFYLGMGRIGPWSSFVVYFLIVTLAAWAGGKWLPGLDLPVVKIHWLTFVISGFIFAFLLFATELHRRSRNGNNNIKEEKVSVEKEAVFRFLWRVTLVALTMAVVLAYI